MKGIYVTLSLMYLNLILIPIAIGGKLSLMAFLTAIAISSYFTFHAMAFRRSERPRYVGEDFLPLLIIGVPLILSLIISYDVYSIFERLLYSLLAFGLTMITWHYLLLVPLAIYYRNLEERERKQPLIYRPLVSVIIPARNEEKVIGHTIRSVLESDYEPKEVIVVDDASTDRTFEVASKYQGPRVKVLRKEVGGMGKARALNFGLRFARGEVVVFIDADTLITREAIGELVRKLQDPNVSAVAGNVMVRNRVNLLTKLQAVEYIATFHLFRKGLSVLGAVPIISGALGAFRRDILEITGFYDADTLTEDFDVTVKALKAGKVVQASSYAVAFTEVPERLRSLYKQRLRWYRGAFEVLFKHKDVYRYPSGFGHLKALDFPLIIMNNLIIPFIDFLSIISIALAILRGLVLPLIVQVILFSTLQILITLISLQIAEEKDVSLAVIPLFAIGYKQFHEVLMLKCFLDVLHARLRGRSFGWTFIERKGIEERIAQEVRF